MVDATAGRTTFTGRGVLTTAWFGILIPVGYGIQAYEGAKCA